MKRSLNKSFAAVLLFVALSAVFAIIGGFLAQATTPLAYYHNDQKWTSDAPCDSINTQLCRHWHMPFTVSTGAWEIQVVK